MPSTISVDVTGDLAERIRRLPERTLPVVDRKVFRVALEIARAIRRRVRDNESMATSQLLNSINVRKEMLLSYKVGPATNYAYYVEHGRKPGRPPPLYAIADWIKDKKIKPTVKGMTTEELAVTIAHSIARKGIAARPFVKPVVEDPHWGDRLKELISAGLDEVFDGLG